MDALGVKIETILKKLEKLDIIESQLNEVHTRTAKIEETISRLDSEVKVLNNQQKKLKKNVEELQKGMDYTEDDISDLQRDNKKLENDIRIRVEEATDVQGELLQAGESQIFWPPRKHRRITQQHERGRRITPSARCIRKHQRNYL